MSFISRVFAVYFFSQGYPCNKNRVPAMRTVLPCNKIQVFSCEKKYTGKTLFWLCTGLQWVNKKSRVVFKQRIWEDLEAILYKDTRQLVCLEFNLVSWILMDYILPKRSLWQDKTTTRTAIRNFWPWHKDPWVWWTCLAHYGQNCLILPKNYALFFSFLSWILQLNWT